MGLNNSILKWAGGKGKALPYILPVITKYIDKGVMFVEPFIGAANVSLNVEADYYLWNDLNRDLINTYFRVFNDKDTYIKETEKLFSKSFDDYYELRDKFNNEDFNSYRAYLFQYLNKHGFNGLCRYNKSGKFNVPRGTVTKTPKKVPVEAIHKLETFKDKVMLTDKTFEDVFKDTDHMDDCVIYCDPPYIPLTSDFNYTAGGFNLDQQKLLKKLAKESEHVTLISNHWTEISQELYSDADEVITFPVQRTISSKGNDRKKVEECLVVYK